VLGVLGVLGVLRRSLDVRREDNGKERKEWQVHQEVRQTVRHGSVGIVGMLSHEDQALFGD